MERQPGLVAWRQTTINRASKLDPGPPTPRSQEPSTGATPALHPDWAGQRRARPPPPHGCRRGGTAQRRTRQPPWASKGELRAPLEASSDGSTRRAEAEPSRSMASDRCADAERRMPLPGVAAAAVAAAAAGGGVPPPPPPSSPPSAAAAAAAQRRRTCASRAATAAMKQSAAVRSGVVASARISSSRRGSWPRSPRRPGCSWQPPWPDTSGSSAGGGCLPPPSCCCCCCCVLSVAPPRPTSRSAAASSSCSSQPRPAREPSSEASRMQSARQLHTAAGAAAPVGSMPSGGAAASGAATASRVALTASCRAAGTCSAQRRAQLFTRPQPQCHAWPSQQAASLTTMPRAPPTSPADCCDGPVLQPRLPAACRGPCSRRHLPCTCRRGPAARTWLSLAASSSRHSSTSLTRPPGTDTMRPGLAACSAAICTGAGIQGREGWRCVGVGGWGVRAVEMRSSGRQTGPQRGSLRSHLRSFRYWHFKWQGEKGGGGVGRRGGRQSCKG
jgi:hypothetical protein